MAKKQNECLNFLKGVACILIVYLHMGFPEPVGSIINVIAKMSVQLFFMVSGYFAWYSSNEMALKKIPGKIKHTFIMLGWAVAASTLYQIAITSIKVGIPIAIKEWIGTFDLKNTIKFVALTATSHIPGWGVLWFLFSLLYLYIIYAAVLKLDLVKVAYRLILPILLFHLVVRYYFTLKGVTFGGVYFQNWLLNGVPFFFLGHWLHQNHDAVVFRFSNHKLLLICLGGIVLANIEVYFVGYMSFYFGTILQVVSLFVFALRNPDKRVCGWIAEIGEKDCFFVYIAHPIVGELVGILVGDFRNSSLYPYLLGAIVAVVCVCMSRGLVRLKMKREV